MQLAAHFVPAADEVWRLQRGNDPECLFFQGFADGGHYRGSGGTRQGIYTCTPDGRLLSSVNSLNPERVLEAVREGLARWEELPEEERGARQSSSIEAAHRWEWSYPDDGLVLSTVVRDLPPDGDPSAPQAERYNFDHAWYDAAEARGFAPPRAAVGTTYTVPRPLVERLVRFHLVDNARGQGLPFDGSEVEEALLTGTVRAVADSSVQIDFEGRTSARSEGVWLGGDNDWKHEGEFPRRLETTLLGSGTFDTERGSFSALELLALGEREGRAPVNGRHQDLGPAPIGFVLELAPDTPSHRVPPAFVDIYDASFVAAPPAQESADAYTAYELLDPETGRFRILYQVSATTAGAQRYFNPIRPGSEVSEIRVTDRMSGELLEHRLLNGRLARARGHREADLEGQYLEVSLARPVPRGGEARLSIDKTYRDAESFFREGEELVFARSLGIARNSVLLPEGYELASCNQAIQILEEAGRLRASFMRQGSGSADFELRARPLPGGGSRSGGTAEEASARIAGAPAPIAFAAPRPDYTFEERARGNREIVYFLEPPETHSFFLYHDYTEDRPGVDRYLNYVRPGSKAQDPAARILDTGEELRVETLHGQAIREAGIDPGFEIEPESEVVVIHFDAVRAGQSVRLRIEETYTDPQRYGLLNGELVWARSFGRNRNAVVLPEGWFPTWNAVPATVTTTADGRVRLDYVNPRSDSIYVILKARRR